MLFVLAVHVCLGIASACSNFYMNYSNPDYKLSVRTMDLGSGLDWLLHSFPRGRDAKILGMQWTSKYGYVGLTPKSIEVLKRRIPVDMLPMARDIVSDGLNEKGLSCGFLTLTGSKFQRPSVLHPESNLLSFALCKWALETCATVPEVQEALLTLRVVFDSNIHFVFQDVDRKTIVVEFIDGEQRIHSDPNDGIEGFGIMTNEPPFDWQLRNVQHFEWKRGLARNSVSVPGNWYPDERFLRVHLVKQAIELTKQPATYREAVAFAVAILNTVTVPMGAIPGTDSGAHSGEGDGDHTQWALVRDHQNLQLYLRSSTNPSLRRIALSSMNFTEGRPVSTMEVEQDPWFIDVTDTLRPSDHRQEDVVV